MTGSTSTKRQQLRGPAGEGSPAPQRRGRRAGRAWQAFLAAAFLLMAIVPPALALNPAKAITQYLQTSWNSESGLPQNSVQAIAQTGDGYLWFGTQEGLTRFDGVHFVTYTRHNAPGLASSNIEALAASRDGSLWVGTDSGLSHYIPAAMPGDTGTFTSLATREGLAGNNITALLEDREGGLWVGSTQGLNRMRGGKIENWNLTHGDGDPAINAVVIDRGGTLWVGTQQGLARFDHGRFASYPLRHGLSGDPVIALAAAPDGSLWAGTASNRLVQIQRDKVVSVQPLPGEISALLADHDGAVWVSFVRHGIARLYHGKLDFYGAAHGLPSDRCAKALMEDREGSLWVGLLDAGAVQLRDGKFSVFGTPEGLSGNYTANVLQAQDGTMWIGADNNGLNHLLADGRVEVWNQSRGLPNQAVYSILQRHDGSLWLGFQRGTIAEIRNGHVSVWRDAQASDSSINALYEDREGRLWAGTFGRGLAEFEHGGFRHITDSGRISGITQTQDGALWIALDGDGAERLQNGRLTRFTTANGLHSDHVMSLYADPDGSVWAGTSGGGISHIHDGRVDTWTPDQNVPDTSIGSILEDNNGNLWFGGDTGIFRIAKKEFAETAGKPGGKLEPVLYGTADGLRSRETLYGSMPCAWKSRDGRLWFGTIDGVAVIDPSHIPINTIVPPVWIERVTFDGHSIPLQNGIRLKHGSGNLEVSFTAPSFVAPQRVRFRYKLVGFDPDWIYAGTRRNAWYTNLPPGNYTFIVQAENNDAVRNLTGASFSFVLRARLAQTPLAYLGYGLAALLLTWGIIAFRTRSLTRHQEQLTRLVEERTAQLVAEKAALEEVRCALHIQATHDSLTGIFNRAAMLEQLEREVARAIRDQSPLGVLIADLDHFKNLNDSYGHLCGDDVIREAAERFGEAMRAYDWVGRYGGEEFLILFPGWDPMVAPGRIDDLLDAIRSRPFLACDTEIRLTCSIGVATFRPGLDAPSLREVLSRADTALYVAKNSGRNCARHESRETTSQISASNLVTANPMSDPVEQKS
ncbi:MAG TPA: two-component regulator propeller domain-containing protein [Acidobacteriaceae bacterium]|jgi:diguanylate cyclase (GGDEF)-like protein|nr:two-component regulator propeller domain-containing protein [Acidobacteriaceae bacterium]